MHKRSVGRSTYTLMFQFISWTQKKINNSFNVNALELLLCLANWSFTPYKNCCPSVLKWNCTLHTKRWSFDLELNWCRIGIGGWVASSTILYHVHLKNVNKKWNKSKLLHILTSKCLLLQNNLLPIVKRNICFILRILDH